MPLPEAAQLIPQPLDPSDLVDFQLDLIGGDRPMLEEGEQVASYTFAVLPEGVALGLQIENQAPYVPALLEGNTALQFWLSVDEEMRSSSAFREPGVKLGLELTVMTNNVPPRRRQRTIAVEVVNQ